MTENLTQTVSPKLQIMENVLPAIVTCGAVLTVALMVIEAVSAAPQLSVTIITRVRELFMSKKTQIESLTAEPSAVKLNGAEPPVTTGSGKQSVAVSHRATLNI